MDPVALLLFFGLMVMLAALPSASVALVVTRAACFGRGHGVAVAAGIVAGDLIFVALAVLGMSFLAELMGGFFAILKWIGGGYLIWLGWQLWRQPPSAELRSAEARRGSLAASFAAGFLLTLGDAKAILFYASLFPALFTPGQLEAGVLCLIVLITVVAVGGVKLLYAIAAQRIVRRVQDRRIRQAFRKTAGGFLMGLGGYVVVRA